MATHSHRHHETFTNDKGNKAIIAYYPGHLDHDPVWGIIHPTESTLLSRIPWVEGYTGTRTYTLPEPTVPITKTITWVHTKARNDF